MHFLIFWALFVVQSKLSVSVVLCSYSSLAYVIPFWDQSSPVESSESSSSSIPDQVLTEEPEQEKPQLFLLTGLHNMQLPSLSNLLTTSLIGIPLESLPPEDWFKIMYLTIF